MKLKLLIVTVLIGISAVNLKAAEYTDVPEVVERAFEKQYPDAKHIDWRKVNDTEYEVEFTRDGKDYEASYKANGVWRETGMILAKDDYPVAIVTAFMTYHPEEEIDEVVYYERGVSGAVYEVEYGDSETLFKPDGDPVPDFTEKQEEKYDKD